jgi:hypothetical protein
VRWPKLAAQVLPGKKEVPAMVNDISQDGFLGSVYYTLRGIMITIGITPPPPGKEWWVALIFFGTCGLIAVGLVVLGAFLLRSMAVTLL